MFLIDGMLISRVQTQYLPEHAVVEVAGCIQGDMSVKEAFDDSKHHHDNHHHSINHLIETQLWVICDVTLS